MALKDKALTFGLAFGVTASTGINGSFGVQLVAITASALRKRDDVQTLIIAIQPAPQPQVILYRNVGSERTPPKRGGTPPEMHGILPETRGAVRSYGVSVRPNLEPYLLQKRQELLAE